MKYLNLTEGFNPYNASKSECIKFESFFFSGGEPHIKILDNLYGYAGDIQVTSRLTSMNDFMMLMIASEALTQVGCDGNIFLFIPYFPGGRQDRRMVLGEPLSVKVFAEFINCFDWGSVETFDNHSDVSTALLDNVMNIANHEFVKKAILDILSDRRCFSDLVIVSPDAGANKKVLKLKQEVDPKNHAGLVKCDKTRDVTNGEITGFEVYTDDLRGKHCVIVDDICDGGGTFLELAQELKKKNAGDIYLVVSHGIFSKPLKNFKGLFKKIYTTDSWRSEFNWEQVERDCTDLVKIIPFKDFL